MILKGIIDTDSVNYKKICMVLAFPTCTFKCDRDCRLLVCQNNSLVNEPDIDIDIGEIVDRYLKNPLTEAIVCQGLEPFDSWKELLALVSHFRYETLDDFVIYTGYNKDEIEDKVKILSQHKNIIIKFGRYVPGQQPHKDEVLGVNLASDNQYAEKIS